MKLLKINFFIFFFTCVSCSSFQHYRSSLKVAAPKNCQELKSAVQTRNKFFQSFSGRGRIKSNRYDFSLAASILDGKYGKIDIRGALGVGVATLFLDKEKFQLFIPREKKVYIVAREELFKNSQKRKDFLRLLPVQLEPSLILRSMSTHWSDLNFDEAQCMFSSKSYFLHFKKTYLDSSSLVLEFNTQDFAQKAVYLLKDHGVAFSSDLLEKMLKSAFYKVEYSENKGDAELLFPSLAKNFKGSHFSYSWHWKDAMPNSNLKLQDFSWRAPRAIKKVYY